MTANNNPGEDKYRYFLPTDLKHVAELEQNLKHLDSQIAPLNETRLRIQNNLNAYTNASCKMYEHNQIQEKDQTMIAPFKKERRSVFHIFRILTGKPIRYLLRASLFLITLWMWGLEDAQYDWKKTRGL